MFTKFLQETHPRSRLRWRRDIPASQINAVPPSPTFFKLILRVQLIFYSAEKVLEAHNTTVAPPGWRTTQISSSAADGDTTVPPAAEPITRRKRHVERPENEHDNDGITSSKHEVNAQVDDDRDHGIATHKHQVNAQDDDGEQHGPRKCQDVDGGESPSKPHGRQQERPTPQADRHSRTPSIKGNFCFSISHLLVGRYILIYMLDITMHSPPKEAIPAFGASRSTGGSLCGHVIGIYRRCWTGLG
jgi:hypothetical protein